MTIIQVPMIFPGQASQSVGMAKDLQAAGGAAAALLDRIDGLLPSPLTSLMFEGPLESLTETRHAQPAILAHSLAVVEALAEAGIKPAAVAGHSLGEFSAAAAAGALTFEVALALVHKRGALMFDAGRQRPGTMAAVMGLPAGQVRRICDEIAAQHGSVVLANHNSETQCVISGEIGAVTAAGEALKAAGARRVTPLNVSGAFHSPLLADAAAQFAVELEATEFDDPAVPLVANVSGRPVTRAADLRSGLKRQLTSPVLWHDSMKWLVEGQAAKPRAVLEVGPGSVLTNLVRRAYPEVAFLPVGTVQDIQQIRARLESLAGDALPRAQEANNGD